MATIVKYAFSIIALFILSIAHRAEAAPAGSALLLYTSQQTADSDSVYVVQQGETFYGLSRRFGVPVDSLQKWNGTQLQTGQTLYLVSPAKRKATASKATVAAETSTAAASAKPATTTPAAKPEASAPVKTQAKPVATTPSKAAQAVASLNESTSASATKVPSTIEGKTKQRILVVPFDPYLYFSDADDEIARKSKIPRQNVRQVFRGRLNALLSPEGYESINLLGGVYRDSVNELRTLYKSLSYSYQDNKPSRYNNQPTVKSEERSNALAWVQRQKDKINLKTGQLATVPVAQDENKHYGVKVKNPEFFNHFNGQYGIDYYVFINQFEVKTNYEHCLDRAAMNYERDFLVHYSIYDSKGELVSGNKVKVPYHSNINDVQRIVSDNMPDMAQRVLADLPPAGK
ncbi:LysM peptidoglycan-binding domain-containing protein [Pontibacter ruber]|uniref:LysM peptidoglycan-binding domain-containing protein n=1 Tax=Pontibacter ruber TaxID=1343895 RepID=A0ABW5CU48_9BACT|nr:LysM peptidoglycan-binding domain-containing protein [Pontibacter ruber]